MTSETRLTQTLVVSEDGLYSCGTLVFDGEIWLVPEWIDDTPSIGFSKPARVIRLLAVQASPPDSGAEFVMPGKLPKCVFDGETSSAEGIDYEILYLPDFFVELPKSGTCQ